MHPYHTADVLRKKPLLVVRLKDVFASPTTPRMRHLPIGQKMVVALPNKLPVVVEHRTDGSWHLVIPNVGNWLLIAQAMPVPCRQLIRQNGAYRLPPGVSPPVRFVILDSTGRRCRNLYMDQDLRVGSAHEIGATTYATKHMTSSQRLQRRRDRVRREFPLHADDILGDRSIRQVLQRRPSGMHRTKWLEYLVRSRHGVMHKGDLPALQTEITAAILDHLWTRHCGPPRHQMTTNFHTTLAPFNAARAARRRQAELDADPPGIGDRRYID